METDGKLINNPYRIHSTPRPGTSTKLDLIENCRKRELGARFRIDARSEIQRISIDVARLGLIDRCPKRELGSRFRIDARREIQRISIDAARLDLIDKCRKRELGARFRIETRT